MVKSTFLKTIFWHVIAVSAFILYELRMIFIIGANARFIDFTIFYTADITFFYLTTYWLLPKVNGRKWHWVSKVLLVTIWVLSFGLVLMGVNYALYLSLGMELPIGNFGADYYRFLWRIVFLFSLALGFWYARYSIRKEREAKENALLVLQASEREARLENALLRAQVNPHLMYNALSGIHAQLFAKSPEAARIILLLSDIMEFAMQGEKQNSSFTLADEITQLEKLVDLNKELHNGRMYVVFTVEVPDAVLQRNFPSMLLINFVDNVFKHGVVTDPYKAAHINIAYDGDMLRINTENTAASRTATVHRKGTGLNNMKQRLRKHFPDRHELKTTSDNGRYSAELILNL